MYLFPAATTLAPPSAAAASAPTRLLSMLLSRLCLDLQHLSFLPPRLAPSSCLCRRLESILSPLFTAASTPVPAPSSAAASAPRLQLAERLRPRRVELSIARGPVLLEERDVVAEVLLLGRPTVPATPQLVELRRGSSASLPQHRLQSCFRLGSRSRQLCAASTPAPLFSAASAPGSQLYAAASSPALLLSHCSIDSGFGSSLRCCCSAPTRLLSMLLPRLARSSSALLVSAGSLLCCRRSLATRSAHRGMTSPRLICSARLVCARLAHRSALSARRQDSSSTLLGLLVGAAYRLVCSARLVGSSRSSSFTDSFVLRADASLYGQRPRPRDAPTVIRQRNTLQPRLVFDRLRAV